MSVKCTLASLKKGLGTGDRSRPARTCFFKWPSVFLPHLFHFILSSFSACHSSVFYFSFSPFHNPFISVCSVPAPHCFSVSSYYWHQKHRSGEENAQDVQGARLITSSEFSPFRMHQLACLLPIRAITLSPQACTSLSSVPRTETGPIVPSNTRPVGDSVFFTTFVVGHQLEIQ
ncbi:hypothetical protein DFH94DRAFT_701949 [Russula ochroleuca]|uniref:Uncharacterized protein n=1 Tax=Russula ochroleuca TaxID=152965 RepID=A0A9P5N5W5_9AGAM|nr:hypothetical protein DFH94DRAFT_701949 [Russula ochroleuca]